MMNKQPKRVFIFDDNPEILELCKDILEDLGCEVRTSPTSNDIEKQVADFMPQLIFMDNWLPDISGVEATKLLKANAELQHIPVIYFTANSNIDELALQSGANASLAKPFDISRIEDLAKEFLGETEEQ